MPDDTPELIEARNHADIAAATVRELVGAGVQVQYTLENTPQLTIPGTVQVVDRGIAGIETTYRRPDLPEELDAAVVELLHALTGYATATISALAASWEPAPTGTFTMLGASGAQIMAALTMGDAEQRAAVFAQLDDLGVGETGWFLAAVTHRAISLNNNEIHTIVEFVQRRAALAAPEVAAQLARELRIVLAGQGCSNVTMCDTVIRFSIATAVASPGTGNALIRELITHMTGPERHHTTWNRNLPLSGATIREAVATAEAHGHTAFSLYRHRNSPADLIAVYVANEPQNSEWAAKHPNTDAATLTAISEHFAQQHGQNRHQVWNVEAALAGNRNTPGEILDELSTNSHPYIREQVAQNESTPLPTLLAIATRAPSSVQRKALRNPRVAAHYGFGLDGRYAEWSAAITSEYRGKPERLAEQLNNEQ